MDTLELMESRASSVTSWRHEGIEPASRGMANLNGDGYLAVNRRRLFEGRIIAAYRDAG